MNSNNKAACFVLKGVQNVKDICKGAKLGSPGPAPPPCICMHFQAMPLRNDEVKVPRETIVA